MNTKLLFLFIFLLCQTAQAEKHNDKSTACDVTTLSTPENKSTFRLAETGRPSFLWQNLTISDVDHFVFYLYNKGKLIHEKELQNTSLSHNSTIEQLYTNAPNSTETYEWKIKTFYKNCSPSETSSNSFTIIKPATVASGGAIVDVFDIKCDSLLAFDSLGYVNYNAKVKFENPSSSFGPWLVSNLSSPDFAPTTGTQIQVSSMYYCSGPAFTGSTITITPGTTETLCFSFKAPFGTVPIYTTANGTMAGYSSIVSDLDSLPSCICNLCEEWTLTDSSYSVQSTPGYPFDIYINQNLQLTGADPIMEMRMEIVSFEHQTSDPLCLTCTSHASDMGLFNYYLPGNPFSWPKDITAGTSIVWQNTNYGTAGKDINTDYFTNQLIWKAMNPIQGIDFSSPRTFRLPLGLPNDASLSCCASSYNICVRYTFTDINCVTCDFLVCYPITRP